MKTNYPEDDENTIYLQANYSCFTLSQILSSARHKWGAEIDLNNISINPEYRHVECLGYDRYDAGDYINYIVIRKD